MRYYRINLLLISLCIPYQASITIDVTKTIAENIPVAVPANMSMSSLYPAAKTFGSYWLNGMNLLGQTTSDVLANLGSLSYKGAEISFDAVKKLYEIGQMYLKEHPETAQSLADWRNIGVASAIALPTLSKLAHVQMQSLIGSDVSKMKEAYKQSFNNLFACDSASPLSCSYQMVAYLLAAKELINETKDKNAFKDIINKVTQLYNSQRNFFRIPYSIAPHSYFRWLYYEGPYIESLYRISNSSEDIEKLRPRAIEAIDWLSKYWASSIPSYFFKRLERIGSAFLGS